MVMTRFFLREVRAESCLLPLNPPQGQARAGATQLGLWVWSRTGLKGPGASVWELPPHPPREFLSASFPVSPGPQKL